MVAPITDCYPPVTCPLSPLFFIGAFALWFIKLIELYVVLHLKLSGAVARLQSQSTWVSNREQHL